MLKTYIRTIWVSAFCATASVIISILSTVAFNGQKYLSLLQNFSVGVACSFIVVIVTVYLQYKNDYTTLYSAYLTASTYLLFSLAITLDDNLTNQKCENLYDILDEHFEEFEKKSKELLHFTKIGNQLQFERDMQLHRFYFDFIQVATKSRTAAVKKIADKDRIVAAIDNCSTFWPNGFEKDNIKLIKEMILNDDDDSQKRRKLQKVKDEALKSKAAQFEMTPRGRGNNG